MPTVYIIIYSLYHHIYKVALDVQKGLEAEGVTVKLFQVKNRETQLHKWNELIIYSY